MNSKIKSGFTFLELLVSIGVIGFVLPALFAVIFIIFQQESKLLRLTEVKRQGDTLLTSMENTIRNNTTNIYSDPGLADINEICGISTTGLSGPYFQMYFKDKNSQMFGYTLSTGSIASVSANPNINLTSSKVLIDSFNISCSRQSRYSTPSITINFHICYITTAASCISTRPEDKADLTYQTQIGLTNY